METIATQIQEEKKKYIAVEGDFNARTGRESGSVREDGRKVRETRKSVNKVINSEGGNCW